MPVIDTDPTDFLDDDEPESAPDPEPTTTIKCPACATSMVISHDHTLKEKEVSVWHETLVVTERTVYKCPNGCIVDNLDILFYE